jgi:hypothetical protein
MGYEPCMLKLDSTKTRQLAATGPMALWRDGTAGREGLVLSAQACASPTCLCRDVAIEGWVVGDQLIGVSFDGLAIRFSFNGTPRVRERKVLDADVNVDSGVVTPDEKRSEGWATEWFRKECDAEMVASLRGQFDAAKKKATAPPSDWRKDDWSKWKPGGDVAWREIHDDDEEASDIVVDGQTYVLGDNYCVEQNCACEEVQVIIWHEDAVDGALTAVGDVTVAPTLLSAAQFHAHGPKRPLLQRVWKAWCDAYPVGALLLARQTDMRKLAPEFQAHMAKRGTRSLKTKDVGANKPCPCGSGKKFKKCCMGA